MQASGLLLHWELWLGFIDYKSGWSIHSVTNGNIFMAEQYSTGVRKQTLGGHKQNLVCTRTQKKGTVAPQENKRVRLVFCSCIYEMETKQVPVAQEFGERNRRSLSPFPPLLLSFLGGPLAHPVKQTVTVQHPQKS
ncbi:hypothetical protein MG293_001823 [Ovis ammon polii]|uniref:Uncharacterized protein n=1 Tax=Ovis ammon polii TaxID=230172 RepID=A0AAD4YIG8_OVIAM|nr:hypothetical protein MG293_001823 [Ovis ammon polii]